MAEGCLACDLMAGRRPLPGGRIHATAHWVVEHCVGPLGLGTLIVKPRRHCLHVWELSEAEASELGPLLRRVTAVLHALLRPDQVYICLWSHTGWQLVHLHFVVQPCWNALQERHARPGPFLQAEMFQAGVTPDPAAVEALAARAREALRQMEE